MVFQSLCNFSHRADFQSHFKKVTGNFMRDVAFNFKHLESFARIFLW